MNTFKNGEIVSVANVKGEPERECRFVGMSAAGMYVCQDVLGEFSAWQHAWPIEEDKFKEFTIETFPEGVVWVRSKDNSCGPELVTVLEDSRACTQNYKTPYKHLLNNYEISLDHRKTWQPAGVKV